MAIITRQKQTSSTLPNNNVFVEKVVFILKIFGFGLLLIGMKTFAYEENVLLLRGENEFFDDVVTGISDELDGEIKIHQHIVTASIKERDLIKLVETHRPKAVLLIGNKAATKYVKTEKN